VSWRVRRRSHSEKPSLRCPATTWPEPPGHVEQSIGGIEAAQSTFKRIVELVDVLFRRLCEPTADRNGWDLGEVVMKERVVTVE